MDIFKTTNQTSTPMFSRRDEEEQILPIIQAQEKTLKKSLPSILNTSAATPSKDFKNYVDTGNSIFKKSAQKSLQLLQEAGNALNKGTSQILFGGKNQTIAQGFEEMKQKQLERNEEIKQDFTSFMTPKPISSEDIMANTLNFSPAGFTSSVSKSLAKEAKPILKGLADDLLSHAKKFKTEEEFVKAQPTIYHGTPQKFEKFDTSKSEGGATWFTADKNEITSGKAGAVQGMGQKLNVMERYVKPNLKLATPKMEEKMYTDQLIAEGYRGVKYPAGDYGAEWTKLFNPNEDTITRSQLSEIWKEANSKSGKTSIGTILGGATLGSAMASTELFSNNGPKTYLPAQNDRLFESEQKTSLGAKIPTSTVIKTPRGDEIRSVPQQYAKEIAKVREKYPNIPKGWIEAILNQESSMGTNSSKKDTSIGEYAWLGGFTDIAKDELTRLGYKYDLNTQEGVIDAIGKFINEKIDVREDLSKPSKRYEEFKNFYLQRYKTNSKDSAKLTPQQIELLDRNAKYYFNKLF